MQQQMAQRTLTQFQEHPDAWTRVDAILETSSVPQTKVFVHVMSPQLLTIVHCPANSRKVDTNPMEDLTQGSMSR